MKPGLPQMDESAIAQLEWGTGLAWGITLVSAIAIDNVFVAYGSRTRKQLGDRFSWLRLFH